MSSNPTLAQYQRFSGSAIGRWLFTRVVCWRAPYFASIAPLIVSLETGRCVARLKQRRRVQNHIGTVHAIALCNLAELTAGLGTDASIPSSMRWIPKTMTVRYLKKANGTMTATAIIPAIESGVSKDQVVAVSVKDQAGVEVFDALITMWVSPRKA